LGDAPTNWAAASVATGWQPEIPHYRGVHAQDSIPSAMSLDGYIAGPKGEADWIIMDPDIDFAALFAQFDTYVMGRRTFEVVGAGGGPRASGAKTFVEARSFGAS
jgi:hypothetical protein